MPKAINGRRRPSTTAYPHPEDTPARFAPRRLLPRLAVCFALGYALALMIPAELLYALLMLGGWGLVALWVGYGINAWLVRRQDNEDTHDDALWR